MQSTMQATIKRNENAIAIKLFPQQTDIYFLFACYIEVQVLKCLISLPKKIEKINVKLCWSNFFCDKTKTFDLFFEVSFTKKFNSKCGGNCMAID